ncbi:MAG TPA: hypothetical protein VH598_01875, partial [Verrucomicrobiae bacterium]|nr:hypothetical protein [Verrucomicrobiae bacterium]
MSSKTGVREMLDLLESLKGAAQDFAAREDKLNQEHRVKAGRERQRRDEAIEELAGKLNAQIAEADASLQTAKDSAKATLELRKARIARAGRSAKEQALKQIEGQVGSRKYELQKQMMQAEPERDAGFAAAANAWQESKDQLAAEHEALVLLEKKAQKAFKGYGAFRRRLVRASKKAETDPAADESKLIADIRKSLGKAREDLARFERIPLPLFFRFLPLWSLLLIGAGVLVHGLFHFGRDSISFRHEVEAVVAVLAGIFIVHFIGRLQSKPLASATAAALGRARRMHDVGLEKADARYQVEYARIEQDYKDTIQRLEQEWNFALAGGAEGKEAHEPRMVQKELRLSSFNNQLYRARLDRLEKAHTESVERLTREIEADKKRIASACEENEARLNGENQAQWRELENNWKSAVQPIYQAINAATAFAQRLFPAWDPPRLADWKPPLTFEHTAKFAQIDVDVSKLCEALPQDPRLSLPGPSRFTAPLSLTYPAPGSILFETINSGRDEAVAALNNIILRLLSTSPPGRLSFTIIDPVGLGQNFAGVMHLADYEEQLINSRIWT